MTIFWLAMINSAVLSALLSLAVWCGLRITPRSALNAATRYAIWWIVLAVTLALPLCYSQWRAESPAPAGPLVPFRFNLPQDLRPEITTAPGPAAHAIPLPIRIPSSQWLRPVLMFWIATSLLLLLRVFVSYAALYRRSARACAAPPRWDGRLETWLARSGSARKGARLAVSGEIEIPIATGPFRAAILIPARLLDGMNDGDLDQIGLHEAAHLARRDDYALFLQRVIEALFALHPVVRWLTRQIDLEREIACDDIVAGTAEQARSYADCLTRTVALCGGVRTSLAAANVADSRSHLSRRVELLLKNGRAGHTGLLKGRWAMVAMALIGAAVMLAKTPLLFAFSTTRVASPAPAPVQFESTVPVTKDLTALKPVTLLAQAQRLADRQLASATLTLEEQRQTGIEQMKAQQFDAAITTFQAIIPEASSDAMKADLLAVIGQAYQRLGNFDKSIEVLEQVIRLLPDRASPLTNIALLYEIKGDKVRARQYYERSLAIDPNNPLALNNLAYLLAETNGDLDLALTYARAAQQKMPNFAEVNDTIGWIYLKKNMVSDALGAFKILTEAMPKNPEYRYHYAVALYRQGNPADALEECHTALANLAAILSPPGRETGVNAPGADGQLTEEIRVLINKIAPQSDVPLMMPPTPILPK